MDLHFRNEFEMAIETETFVQVESIRNSIYPFECHWVDLRFRNEFETAIEMGCSFRKNSVPPEIPVHFFTWKNFSSTYTSAVVDACETSFCITFTS